MAKGYLVCRDCKRLIENDKDAKGCQICKTNNLVDKFKGRVVIVDAYKSEIAKTINVVENGNYAIKL